LILIISLLFIAAMAADGFSLMVRATVYLFLVFIAFLVFLRRAYPVLRANGHLLATWAGKRPARASPHYIRALFDEYAEDFDRHLMIDLAYRAPNLIAGIIRNHVPDEAPDVLDLGCGTGICGPLLAPLANPLTGIDLSPKALEAAKAKNCYDALIEADFVDFLTEHEERADLCVAADVLVYFGDLDEPLAAVWRGLRDGGFFAFTLETADVEEWKLRKTGRYAHSARYVERRAQAGGFEIIEMKPATLRTEADTPVTGIVCLLRKP
ncbi:MAG: methyltransferase domain-containing protein, partial [Pirellulales bacterium]|nr:methyltransferase domain-containing protein [Pirellulales bacterium]